MNTGMWYLFVNLSRKIQFKGPLHTHVLSNTADFSHNLDSSYCCLDMSRSKLGTALYFFLVDIEGCICCDSFFC